MLTTMMISGAPQQQQQQHFGLMYASPSATPSGVERCAVCADRAQGIHFGVLVCRACAAFFRRSTIEKRVYRCRYDGKCGIDQREVRCSCRACRLAKCVALGMDPSAVQRHRDQLGPRRKQTIQSRQQSRDEMMQNGPTTTTSSLFAHQQHNSNSLLPPLGMALSAAMHQHQIKQENEAALHKRVSPPATAPPPQPQPAHRLHFEDGKSYALLGAAPSRPGIAADHPGVEAAALTDQLLLLHSAAHHQPTALFPSAFSPVMGHQQQQTQSDSGHASASSSAFSSPLNANHHQQQQQQSPSTTIAAPPSCASSHATAAAEWPLIGVMARGYHRFVQLRHSAQQLDGTQSPFAAQQQQPLVEGDYTLHSHNLKADVSLLSEMVNEHFAPLHSHFALDSKWTLLRNFFCAFVIAERSRQSALHFAADDTRFLIGHNQFMDVQRLEHFFAVDNCKTSPAEIARVFHSTFSRIHTMIRRQMVSLRLADEEFVALVGLLFWNDKVDGLSDQERTLARQTRECIFAELYKLCRRNTRPDGCGGGAGVAEEPLLGGDEAGIRFCAIVNLFHFCLKMSSEIAANFSLVAAMRKFEVDQFLHQFNPQAF